jgi:hypothetical protein
MKSVLLPLGRIEFALTAPVLSLNTSVNTLISLQQSGTTQGYIGTSGGTNAVIVGASANDLNIRSQSGNINFSNNAGVSASMRIDSSGRVGIGTTSPDTALHVVGAATSTQLLLTDATNATIRMGTPAAGIGILSVNTGQNLVFGHQSSSGSSYTERARIDGSGNVLLGKASQNLATAGFQHRGDAIGLVQITRDSGEPLQLNRLTNDGKLIEFRKDTTAVVGAISIQGSDLGIEVNGSERMRINSSGNVGIGTASPKMQLQTGTSGGFQASAAGELAIRYNMYYSSGDKYIGSSGKASSLVMNSNGEFIFYNTNTASTSANSAVSGLGERMRIDSSGNVGIGSTTPSSILHLQGSNPVLTMRDSDTAGDNISSYILLEDSSGNDKAYIGRAGSSDLRIFGNGDTVFATGGIATSDESVRIDTSGRLLVGTSSSSTQGSVVVVGNSNSSTGEGELHLARGATPTSQQNLGNIHFGGVGLEKAAQIICKRDGGTWTSGTSHPSRLEFSVTADGSASPSEAMRINNAGELLVGYTSDNGAYKLQVNSQIFATSATIATSDGRYKENVAALNGCVDLVKALRPVSFDWKAQEPVTRVDEDGETVVVREAHNFPDGKQVGFIAQEVEAVLADKPWLGSVIKQNVRPAVTDNDGNELAPEEEFLGIAEGNLVAVLTSALKDAIGRIENLEAEVAALKA